MSKKIWVTGSSGFLGKNLVPKLKQKYGSENIFTPASTFDLRSKKNARLIIKFYKPDIIIHAAGSVGGIGANRKRPGEFIYDNLMMGMNVIDEARIAGISKFIMLGTVCSYPKFTPVPFKIEDFWNGYPEETNAPYGIAKKALIELLSAYKKQYDFNSTVLIPTNMYGPYDHFLTESNHVIPAIFNKFFEAVTMMEKEVTFWGTGEASRDFLFVEDCVDAIMKAIEVDSPPVPINLGTGVEVKIKDLVNMIAKYYGGGDKMKINWDASKPDGQPRRCLDISTAKDFLNWKAATSLEDGLKTTSLYYFHNKMIEGLTNAN